MPGKVHRRTQRGGGGEIIPSDPLMVITQTPIYYDKILPSPKTPVYVPIQVVVLTIKMIKFLQDIVFDLHMSGEKLNEVIGDYLKVLASFESRLRLLHLKSLKIPSFYLEDIQMFGITFVVSFI